MYGRRRVWEIVTVIVPMRLGRFAARVRSAPLAYALVALAAGLAFSVLVRGLRAGALDLDGALRLIVAGLALCVAVSEGSRAARAQRSSLRQMHDGHGL